MLTMVKDNIGVGNAIRESARAWRTVADHMLTELRCFIVVCPSCATVGKKKNKRLFYKLINKYKCKDKEHRKCIMVSIMSTMFALLKSLHPWVKSY